MHQYAIGLDLGTTSVGWAALALDSDENPCGILDMSSRIFSAAEHPKTGASLALPRRKARSTRRRLRRHRHRNERIRYLFVSSGLITQNELDTLFDGKLSDIYALRVKALDKPVSNCEFARILLHISQRRGFKSNRKNVSDKEDGKLLEALNENKNRMESFGYRTAGEMYLHDKVFSDCKRNKGGNYLSTVTRDMIADEVRMLFEAQRRLGADYANKNFEEAYLNILLSQRSFDEGPGGNSPYSGSQIERMIGSCTLITDEPRAPKAAYSFELFSLYEKINHIRLICGGKSEPLNVFQRQKLVELAHEKDNLTFASVRKALSLDSTVTFNMVRYPDELSIDESEKKEKFNHLKAYHQMRKAVDKNGKGRFSLISVEKRNKIAKVLSTFKTEKNVLDKLRELELEECDLIALSSLSFSKFGHLSVKACDKLIPFLERGMNYNDACAAAGYDFRAHSKDEKSRLLPPLDDDCCEITSPVVRRTISQTIKVVNAIIRRYGESPVYVNIELARELSKDFSERKKIEREYAENRAKNEKIMEQIAEYKFGSVSGLDLVKMKLYEEQGGVCMYSQQPIIFERLFEPNYAEIDHIIPYSISFDDSFKNKVLVLKEENQNKGNRLPMQYLTGKRQDDFRVWVNSNVRDYRKKRLLLKESFTEEDGKAFKERALQDTKTAAVFMLSYIDDNLLFAPSLKGRKKRVTAVNGAVTSYMRKRWGITKIREDGDLHHAVDAVVIACTTDAMIQKVSKYASWRECHYMQTENGSMLIDPTTGEVKQEFPFPWEHFTKELIARTANNPSKAVADLKLKFYLDEDAPKVRPLFVSRMPTRKISGAAHKETYKSAKALDDGYAIVKKPLTALKLNSDGEIMSEKLKYYKPESDRLLYDALKKRLEAFGGDGEKAFADKFYKPRHDGTPGHEVRKVKMLEPSSLNVPVLGDTAVADNDSMVRIDVFKVEGDGYYLVPIYVADILKEKLPNLACIAHKSYNNWKEMSDSSFIFSLYPNDLVKIKHKRGIKLTKNLKGGKLSASIEASEFLLYYNCANISSGAISCTTHDNTYKIDSLGIKTLEKLEKYEVDVLGEYHPVRQETRQGFSIKKG